MAQIVKLETQVQLKGSPDQFYAFLRNNMSRLAQLFPENVKRYELVGGGVMKTGSVTRWSYSVGGSAVLSANIKIEALDDARKSITFLVLEGDVLRLYKTFKATVQVGSNYAKWTFEFEKASADAPNPTPYTELAAKISKGLDAYLSN